MSKLPDHIAVRVAQEASLWAMAADHPHLNRLFEQRYRPGADDLSSDQKAAIFAVQGTGFAVATQMVSLRMMSEMNCMLKQYVAIKGSSA